MNESVIQTAILGYLNLRGDCMVWRNNTGGLRDAAGRIVRFGFKGSGDILGVIAPSGRFLSVECKRPSGGVLSKEQEAFGAQVRAAGGIYIVARSVDEVRAALPPVTVKLPPMFRRVVPR